MTIRMYFFIGVIIRVTERLETIYQAPSLGGAAKAVESTQTHTNTVYEFRNLSRNHIVDDF